MNFIKMLIGIPLIVVILVFAFVNNDLASFSLWPFYVEVTVSLSVAIVFLFIIGFAFGSFFTWMSYAPALREQKAQNKRLSKEHVKLVEQVTDLQENLNTLKPAEEKKPTFYEKAKNIFKRKKKDIS